MAYTKQDCIDSLRKAAKQTEGKLSNTDYRKVDILPSSSTIESKFGSWDEAKEAAGLKQFDANSINQNIPENREWGEKEWIELEAATRSRERKKSILSEIKVNRGCSECGYSKNPVALQFHHLNPEEKDLADNGAMSQIPFDKLEDEIEKCIVLCANCHMIEEYDDGRYTI